MKYWSEMNKISGGISPLKRDDFFLKLLEKNGWHKFLGDRMRKISFVGIKQL
jgi:hypothetical protein